MDTLLKAKIPCEQTGITINKSICTICDPTTQCGLDVFVKDGKVVKVEGSDEHPYNQGTLCSKGAATRQYIYHEDRIKTPLKRVGPRGSGKFEPITWDEALDIIEKECLNIKNTHGPESVVFFGGYTKYFRPYLRRLAHSFGSPNYATESSTCHQATVMSQKLVYGSPGGPDMKNTDCLLVWSSNPFHTNPGNARNILSNLERGMKMIVVDPRETPTSARADLHLRLRPGTDGALALSMANVIIEENLYDKELIANYSYGFDEYKAYVKEFPPEKGEELTGVPAGKIRQAARMFAGVRRGCIMPSASPVVHHTNGVQNYRAIFMLLPLTGNYDVKGGNFANPATFIYMPGNFECRQEEFEASKSFDKMAPRIGAERFPVWAEMVEQAQAMYLPKQLRTAEPYPIKCLLGFGMNYRMWPDSEGLRESLKNLDLFVNIDLFMTDTCKEADIVLPACSSLERSEMRCYGMGYVIYTQPAIKPLYESRSDTDIIFELAKRLCPDDELMAKGYEACIDWMLEPSGMNVNQLKEHPGGMFVPNPRILPEQKYKKGAKTPSGKIEFKSKVLEKYGELPGLESLPVYTPPRYSKQSTPELAEEYPFILNSGSRLPMFVHTRTYRLSWTKSLRPDHPSVDLNPDDAKTLGISQNDEVILSTPHDSIRVKVNLTQMVQPGVVHMYHGSSVADVNRLFEGDYVDPISGFPGYKSALCKVEKGGH